MALDPKFLQYPHRGPGMDHQRYAFSQLHQRPPVHWPDGARVALWLNICVQFYPLNQRSEPFAVPGGMTMPYPDLRHFSLRDYGNRVGIYRLLELLDRFRLRASFAVNGSIVQRAPWLMSLLAERGDEVLAHGWDMDSLHHGGLSPQAETDWIKRTVAHLQQATGRPVKGWLSPARNESPRTPELLAQQGIEWFADWVNDELPYRFHTDAGALWAMPLSNELEDRFVLMQNLHSEQSWAEQVCDACDFLLREAESGGGRLLSLNLHPWLLGQPHRIRWLQQVLEYLGSKDGLRCMQPAEILTAVQAAESGNAAGQRNPDQSQLP